MENIIYIYIREKPDGENLSLPLKMTVNVLEDKEHAKRLIEECLIIENKCLDKKEVYKMYDFLDKELNVSSIIDKEEIIKKIIEFNFYREKI